MKEPTKITQEEKDKLVSTPVYLDGKPARICGSLLDFPVVRRIDIAMSVEFSWGAVKRIVESDRKFKS